MEVKHILPKPKWLKIKPPGGDKYLNIKKLSKELKIATVCEEARCPNMSECWGGGTATFMLMGEICTRGCRFCAVKTGNPKGVLDKDEPRKVGEAILAMGLEYVVLTSVDRDDLEDEGASHFAETVRVLKKVKSDIIVEVLTPDFHGKVDLITKLVEAAPDVFAHNVETVERLSPKIRDPRASYALSLDVLEKVKKIDSSRYTKSSIMLGLGETDMEILQSLKDLRAVGCDVVTFGQYLQATKLKLKVQEYVTPQKFDYWKEVAEEMGFLYVASGPLVRSSYKAGEFFMEGIIKKNREQQQEQRV